MTSLSEAQKELLIFGVQDSYTYLTRAGRPEECRAFVEALAEDEPLLRQFEAIFQEVCRKRQAECGDSSMWANQGGLWNMQTHQDPQSTQAAPTAAMTGPMVG